MLIFLKEKGTGWPHTGNCINSTNDISSLFGIQRRSIEQLRYYFFGNKPHQAGYRLPVTSCRSVFAFGFELLAVFALSVQLYYVFHYHIITLVPL
jgi:hypothetical protein